MPPTTARGFPRGPQRSPEKIRTLDAAALGATPTPAAIGIGASVSIAPEPLACEIAETDPLLQDVRQLLADGFAGAIFTGPPGTSKSWYAAQIAARLADLDAKRVRRIQFHASYQYEDFVEGFVPRKEGGFELRDKHLLEMCTVARDRVGQLCIMVIDELSRCDPGRVFGEALTYIEMTRRDQTFFLASGREVSIPPNLVILATMNPLDRGVDEVDAALERRFARIAMDPDAGILERFLIDSRMDEALRRRVLGFFRIAQSHPNPYCKIGHTYFRYRKTEDDLRRLWDHQLRFLFEKAFRLDPEGLRAIQAAWRDVVPLAPSDTDAATAVAPAATVVEGGAAPEGPHAGAVDSARSGTAAP